MRTKRGVVTSTKMDKTVVVSVYTYKSDSKYKKRYRVTNKFYAHDEKNLCNE
jgi:small subunit ribosomal protein S17